MNIKQIISAFTTGFIMVLVVPAFVLAAPMTEVVTESDVTRQLEDTTPTNKWVVYTRAGTPSTAAAFRTGPAIPPLGTGSLELTTVSSSDKVYAFNFDHVGTRLADVNDISYNTFRTAGSAQQVAALNVVIDFNGPNVAGGFSTLVFEPVYNTDQGAVNSGVWQNWNAGDNTIWWSSKPINGAPNRDTFVTLASIKQANPDATIGGVGINQGSGNPGLTTAVDAFTFDKVTYDFEQKPVKATSKEECKNDGYKNFQTPYKNQGDCVSSVVSNGKDKGNLSVVESLSPTVRGLFNL